MRAPFTLQGTQPGIVAEFYLALTRADEPPPPPPVHTADPPAHPHDAHRPEPIHHPSSQEEGSGSSDVSFDVSFAPGGDLQLDPAGCELDAEMAVQLKAGEMEAQGQAVQAVQAQAQADTEEGGRGGSAHTLWRTFTLSQPGPPLDHLEALVRGARCAVVTCSPVASSDTSPRCVPPPPPPPAAPRRPPTATLSHTAIMCSMGTGAARAGCRAPRRERVRCCTQSGFMQRRARRRTRQHT